MRWASILLLHLVMPYRPVSLDQAWILRNLVESI
jgi:hypothetical protein